MAAPSKAVSPGKHGFRQKPRETHAGSDTAIRRDIGKFDDPTVPHGWQGPPDGAISQAFTRLDRNVGDDDDARFRRRCEIFDRHGRREGKLRTIDPGIGQPQPAENVPEHAVRTKSTKMPGVTDIDDVGRPPGKSREPGAHGLQRLFRLCENPLRLLLPVESLTKSRYRRERLAEGRLAFHIKRQGEDGRNRLQPAGIAGVEGRYQDEVGSGELQKLEVRGTPKAKIRDAARKCRLDRAGPELNQLRRRDGHDAEGHRCLEHRPVNGRDTRRRSRPRRPHKSRRGEQT
ncbi:Hypothetical protein AT6N2_L0654 [Agrobacterium tumefaciens]|nr:Hypothetical protein AT6N2_L0654 [Agrobacterium tumefaciens]